MPVVVWAFATLFLGGNLGKLTDDLSHHRYDVAARAWSWPPFELGETFWRPLQSMILQTLQTVLWEHDALNHAISAAAHGLCAIVLWGTMLAAGRTRRAAGAAALLMLVYPAQWEVVFWPSGLAIGLSTTLLLAMIWLVCLFARGRVGWWVAGLLPVLTFAACCLNEQPAAGVVALPLISLAVASGDGRLARRLARAIVPPALGALGGLGYAVLYLSTSRPGMRGTPESLVSFEALPERVGAFAAEVGDSMLLRDFGPGAFAFGWRELGLHGPVTLLWLGVFVLAATPWMLRWTRLPALAPGRTVRAGAGSLLLTLAFGTALVVATWAPLLPIERYAAPSRMCYAPFVGVLFAMGALLDAGAGASRRRRRLAPVGRWIVALGLIWLAAGGAVMMVGVQTLLRARWRMDSSQASQLAGILPEPTPDTAFLPLALWDLPARTGARRFDTAAIGAFRLHWSAPPLVKWVYGRDDVTAGSCYVAEGRTREVIDADAEGIVFPRWLGRSSRRVGEGAYRVPWSSLAPFVVDGAGRVRLVSRVVVRRAGREEVVAEPAQAAALVRAGAIPEREFILELP